MCVTQNASVSLRRMFTRAFSLRTNQDDAPPSDSVEPRSSAVEIEGYLTKRARNTFTWNRRWFTIQDNQLIYKTKEKITVMMRDLTQCLVKNFKSISRHFCFKVVSSTKSCVLQADSESLKQDWIRAIQDIKASSRDDSKTKELEDLMQKIKIYEVELAHAKEREDALRLELELLRKRLEMKEDSGTREQLVEDEQQKINVQPTCTNVLRDEELDRYCNGRQIRISVVTWNMAENKELPENLADLFPTLNTDCSQDMYAIGVQEGCPDSRAWQRRLQETLGPRYVVLHAAAHGVLYLTIFIRRDHAEFCSRVEAATVTTRIFPQVKTKGAVGFGFTLFGTSFLFITSHFNAGASNMHVRIQNYKRTIKGLALPRSPRRTKRNANLDVTTQYDKVFWFGDFNFHLREDREKVEAILTDFSGDKVDSLLQYDQLTKARNEGSIFQGFHEATIHFPPTYKFDIGTDVYDTSSKQRTPSYTDRIMHRSQQKEDIEVIQYMSCPSIKTSDHRPVTASFQVKLQPENHEKLDKQEAHYEADTNQMTKQKNQRQSS